MHTRSRKDSGKSKKLVLPPCKPSDLCWAKVSCIPSSHRGRLMLIRSTRHPPTVDTVVTTHTHRTQVPGWQWWPARVLPPVEGADQQDERVVVFLVDNTVATVPATLPQFDAHYSRFLQACYANKVRSERWTRMPLQQCNWLPNSQVTAVEWSDETNKVSTEGCQCRICAANLLRGRLAPFCTCRSCSRPLKRPAAFWQRGQLQAGPSQHCSRRVLGSHSGSCCPHQRPSSKRPISSSLCRSHSTLPL